jgi:molybdenum cofactor synthesis domain-containing protein
VTDGGVPAGARARVITVSDRAHAGAYPDRSGPLLGSLLAELGFGVDGIVLVPDDVEIIVSALLAAVGDGVALVVTTGGTGLAPRDVTPEATRQVIEREVPGLAEALRAAGREAVPTAVLSRGLVGTRGATLLVNLPGSTGGVRDGVATLAPVVAHAVVQVRGGDDHPRHLHGDDDKDRKPRDRKPSDPHRADPQHGDYGHGDDHGDDHGQEGDRGEPRDAADRPDSFG